MSKEIKKYVTSYVVTFRSGEKIEIYNEAGIRLKKDIENVSFVHIGENIYNKFEIVSIKKRNEEFDFYEMKKRYGLLDYSGPDILSIIEKLERKNKYFNK